MRVDQLKVQNNQYETMMQQKNKDLIDKIRELDNIKQKYEDVAKTLTQVNANHPPTRASIRLSKVLNVS